MVRLSSRTRKCIKRFNESFDPPVERCMPGRWAFGLLGGRGGMVYESLSGESLSRSA